ncbi:MAG: sugar phosphate isomerase/epimerase family protein [Vicinamibacteraceae bacterium]
MTMNLTRRDFTKAIAVGLGAGALARLQAAGPRKLEIGHTCITWGTFPRGPENKGTLEAALEDISSLGFWGFETFPQVLGYWDAEGKLNELIDRYNVPLTSAYLTVNVTDPARRKETVAEATEMSKLVKKYGGRFLVVSANSVRDMPGYDFAAHRADIITSLNEYGKAIMDVGLGTGLHQHTGTAVDTEDQVYAVMEGVDTRYMKFAPDVGQLQKAGADAAKVVKDFLPITVHMHLKDWKGWEHHSGYCPVGQGKVAIEQILDMVESKNPDATVMVELDPSDEGPMTPLETAQATKTYLQKLGFTFRSS